MNFFRTPGHLPASVAAAAVTSAVLFAATRLAQRPKAHGGVEVRHSTGGCTPDFGAYVDGLVVLEDADGTHQGLCVAMLRDRFTDDETPADPVETEYGEVLRSCVEVAICLALNMADAAIDEQCDCGDDDCGDGTVDYEVLHLIAGRKMTEFAISFETAAAQHAAQCRVCAREGTDAPGFLRARFCRDLADDLLTNFDSDAVTLRGVPIDAALDAVSAMVEVIEQGYQVPAQEQIDKLTLGIAQAIAHAEGHEVPRP